MTWSPGARRCLAVTLAIVMSSCARGADESRLQSDIQEKLNRDIKPGLFEVVAVRREGSAPLPSGDGAERVVVYFNVTLQLSDSYQFGGWDQLGPASVAFALGATEKGLFGLTSENRPGDMVRAYGSAIYERTGDGWALKPAEAQQAAAAPNIEGSAPPSQSKQLIDRLAAMVELPPPGVPPQQDEIIAEELAAASENIERRVRRRNHVFTLATGPASEEYARLGDVLIGAIAEFAPLVKLRQRHSPGSVENAWLLARGEADYAIVQGDVAAAAFTGDEPFARGGPLSSLRAVGALFPEAIHVIVLPDSPFHDVSDLRGRRVALGVAASGSRFSAEALLAAHDIKLTDLAEAPEIALETALTQLRRKQVDAVIVTGAAPIRALQQFATAPGFRLLPLKPARLDALVKSRPGLAPLILPANTYPRQQHPVATAAALALLLTTSEAPPTEVERVLGVVASLLIQRPAGRGEDAGATAQFRGVTIPLHPGAAAQVR